MILLWDFFNKLNAGSKREKVMGIMCYRKEAARAEDIVNVPDLALPEDLLNTKEGKNHPHISTNCI